MYFALDLVGNVYYYLPFMCQRQRQALYRNRMGYPFDAPAAVLRLVSVNDTM